MMGESGERVLSLMKKPPREAEEEVRRPKLAAARTALPPRAAFVRHGAGDLAFPEGITVAGQRRILTGFAAVMPAGATAPTKRMIGKTGLQDKSVCAAPLPFNVYLIARTLPRHRLLPSTPALAKCLREEESVRCLDGITMNGYRWSLPTEPAHPANCTLLGAAAHLLWALRHIC